MDSKTEQLYEEWSGDNRHVNDCKPTHDSTGCIEFADYCLNARYCQRCELLKDAINVHITDNIKEKNRELKYLKFRYNHTGHLERRKKLMNRIKYYQRQVERYELNLKSINQLGG